MWQAYSVINLQAYKTASKSKTKPEFLPYLDPVEGLFPILDGLMKQANEGPWLNGSTLQDLHVHSLLTRVR